jgi:hypothetical protein
MMKNAVRLVRFVVSDISRSHPRTPVFTKEEYKNQQEVPRWQKTIMQYWVFCQMRLWTKSKALIDRGLNSITRIASARTAPLSGAFRKHMRYWAIRPAAVHMTAACAEPAFAECQAESPNRL